MSFSSDHRINKRKKFLTSTRITIDGVPSFYTGLVKNISEGGVFVHTYNILEPGTKLQVKFQLPPSKEIVQLPAEVMWIRTSDVAAHPEDVGFGVRFTSMPEELKQKINKYLAKEDTIFYL